MAETEAVTRSQRILGGAADDTIERVQATMVAFERMWGGIKVLAENHPARQGFLENFIRIANTAFEESDGFRLDVEPYAFTMDGQEILAIDRENDNYIYRLYQDGIRHLSFQEGLSLQEIDTFLKILMGMFSDVASSEDDIVTLLWDASLEHITHEAIEGFAGSEKAGDDDEGEDISAAGEGVTGISSGPALSADEVSKWATAGAAITDDDIDMQDLIDRKQAVAIQFDEKRMRDEAAELLDGVVEDKQDKAEGVFTISEEQQSALAQHIRASQSYHSTKFGEIALLTRYHLGEEAGPLIARAFGEFAKECMRKNEITVLVRATSAIVGIDTLPGAAALRTEIFEGLQDPAIADKLVASLGQAQEDPEVKKLLKVISGDSFPMLWRRLTSTTDMATRRRLKELLEASLTGKEEFLIEQLRDGDERSSLVALAMLRKIDYTAVLRDMVQAGLRHKSAPVRLEVINTIRKIDDPVVHTVLPRMLKDADESVRARVMDVMLRIAATRPEDNFIYAIRDLRFAERSDAEQKRFVLSLGRVATEKGMALIRKMALDPVDKKISRDLRVAAIQVLGARGGEQSLAGLQKLTKSFMGNKDLKNAAKLAIASIERRRTQS